MSVVNTETGELIEVSYSEVRQSVSLARESGAKFFEQIVWQIEHQAWIVLGYSSWDEMRETEYADMGVVVPRADRPEIVARMRKVGLTQAQIAATTGVSEATIRNDLNRRTAVEEPTITNARGQQRPASYNKTPDPAQDEVEAPASPDAPPPALPKFADFMAERAEPTGEDDEAPRPPSPSAAVSDFVNADHTVQLTSWRRNFMAAIAKSGSLMLFAPDEVAEKADVELLRELERLSHDLNNYVSRVQAKRPHRLTAIQGGAK